MIIYTGPFGYVGAAPPILDGTADDPPCPYCHLGPCIITRGPSWLVGSSAPSLGNLAKRYGLYRKFWRVLRQLGVWSHPLYLNEKMAHTTLTDVREVMPKCFVTVSWFFFTHTSHKLCTCCFRMSEEDSRTRQEYITRTLNLQASLLNL